MNGIYAMYFTGLSGSGFGVFVLMGGKVTGADAAGGVIDGTYEIDAEGCVKTSITLRLPAGASLVTGARAGSEPLSQEISAVLPRDFSNGQVVPLKTPTGPVNISFKRLRGLP